MKHTLQRIYQSWVDEYKLIIKIANSSYPNNQNRNEYELSYLERSIMIVLVFFRSFSLSHIGSGLEDYKSQSHFSESYVIVWFGIFIYILFSLPTSSILVVIITYRLIDGFVYRLCIIFVDRYKSKWGLRSTNRAIILALINYFELIVGFAYLYMFSGSIASNSTILGKPLESLYFSFVTITTLGYGDFSPVKPLGQILVIVETMMGVILLVLIIGTYITGINDIHNLKKNKN